MTHIDPHHETAPLHDPPDPWHAHTPEEKPQQPHAEVMNARAVILVGVGLFVSVVVTVVIIYQYYVWYTSRMLDERATQVQRMNYKERVIVRDRVLADLRSAEYGWVDHDTVRVPIDVAINEVIEEYQGRR